MKHIPHEFDFFGGIYLAPALVATIIGVVLAILTAKILNKYHLAKYFSNIPLVFIAMIVIFTLLVDLLFVAF